MPKETCHYGYSRKAKKMTEASIPATPIASKPKTVDTLPVRPNDINRNTNPIKVEQTGDHEAICTHEDGSEFEFEFPGQFPSKLKHDGSNPEPAKPCCCGIGEGQLSGRAGKTSYVYVKGVGLVEKKDGVIGDI